MRLQIQIIAVLSSLLMWGLAFNGARDAFHLAKRHGLTPHIGIERSIRCAFGLACDRLASPEANA